MPAKGIVCLPQHVAIVMDGNGRWAAKRGLPRLEGHRAGADNVRRIVQCAAGYHIKYLTLYAFSTENWSRPAREVDGLFRLLEACCTRELAELHKNGVRVRHIGRLEALPATVRQQVTRAVELTRDNESLVLTLAINYGGRAEILDAVRRVLSLGLRPEEVDEELIGSLLHTAGLPDVDLVVRTGGELRLSNFLLWQTARSQSYFTKVEWPDFNRQEFHKALQSYGLREGQRDGHGCELLPPEWSL